MNRDKSETVPLSLPGDPPRLPEARLVALPCWCSLSTVLPVREWARLPEVEGGTESMTKAKRERYVLVKSPGQGRRWTVDGPEGRWVCDSEEIAREVVRRLNAGKAPGWAAHDLRHSSEKDRSL